MRKEVKWFADEMEKILKKNDHKGGWEQEDLDYLFTCLKEEVKELRKKLPKDWLQWLYDSIENPKEIIKECVDIADFAMMIACNVKESQNER